MKVEFNGTVKEIQPSKFTGASGQYEIFTILVSRFFLDANQEKQEKIYAIKVFVNGASTTQTYMRAYLGKQCKFVCYWKSVKSKTNNDYFNDVTLHTISEANNSGKNNEKQQQSMSFADESKKYTSATIEDQDENSSIKIGTDEPPVNGEEPDDLPF